ncbi:MAG TPA: anti-sigma factor [Rhizobacter sp.]|nr:anti-sigma factor [Rhizobacter sp.]
MDYSRPELVERLAAEYVAGTVRGGARRRFESLLSAHPALRSAVRRWEARLMPLTASVSPQQPSAQVWKRVEARIGVNNIGASAPASRGWWTQLAFWRGLSAVATVATLTLAVLLGSPPPARAPVVVVLSAAGAPATASGVVAASFVASISADGRAMVTQPLTQVSMQADKVLELWAVPPQGAPRSLGLISAQGATAVQRGRVLDNTAAFAVSLEPTGGSPTGAPTGPILYIGKLVL